MKTKIVITVCIISISLLFLSGLVIANQRAVGENCNPNIEPESYEENGLYYTRATPNHQRPCSAPILFGGKE